MNADQTAKALIVVDVQNDFCPGGALAVADGDAVVPTINELADRFRLTAFTRDWHPANHCSFSNAPQFVDRSWPVHCVADTPGAAYHPGLQIPDGALHVCKGTDPDVEAYSGFQGTDLAAQLKQRGVTEVFVCGLATDYCVKHTALDARKSGFNVNVIADACRAVDLPPGTGEDALDELRAAGVSVVQSKEIPA